MKLPKVPRDSRRTLTRAERALRVARVLGGVAQSNDPIVFGQAARDWMRADSSVRKAFIRWFEKQP